MGYLLVKSALSGLIIMLVSETARRSPSLGALIASLPLVSVLAMIWLYHETNDTERLANHALSTFWYVLPSLPMFLVLLLLLRYQWAFYPALAASCALTITLYALMVAILARFGITL